MAKKAKPARQGHGQGIDLSNVSDDVAEKLGIKPVKDGDEYVSPNDIGKMLGVTGEAVKQWIYHRRLPAVKLSNGYWKVKISSLKSFLEHRQNHGRRKIVLATGKAEHVKIVEAMGHEAIPVSSLTDAVLKTADITPALVVIDVGCLQMRPWELGRKLRETKQTKNCPILLVGVDLLEQDTEKALAIRASGFASADPKPFKDELLRLVGE